jgi:hypothetical protein
MTRAEREYVLKMLEMSKQQAPPNPPAKTVRK